MFSTVKLTRNASKRKFICNGYGISFGGAETWSFGNKIARNVVIFCVDNSLSIHSDDRKNSFLVLLEGLTDDINDNIYTADKKVWY